MEATMRRQLGVAAVEFAILLFPVLTILFGITEFGRVMYQYNAIAKSARDATRLLSTQAPSDPDYPTLVNEATCTAVYGNPACSGTPLLPGLATSMVRICDPVSCPGTHASITTGTGVVNLVTVTIGGGTAPYRFTSLAPVGVPSFDFSAVSVTMRQVL
jgi:Flp pilus assembly protein TadG